MQIHVIPSLAVCFCASSASAQQQLHSIDGTEFLGLLGWAVGGAGDVDADGYDDFIVGARGAGPNGEGVARVYSGLDAALLYEFFGAASGDEFGRAVAGAGDVNADGVPDIVIGADQTSTGGSVFVFSGLDGSQLHHFQGDGRLGQSVAGAGDVDADGHDDILAGAPFGDGVVASSGTATVFSGLDGSVLHTFSGTTAFSAFGTAVDGVGDVDHDGYDDVVVSAYREIATCSDFGTVQVFSGADGSVLFDLNGGLLEAFGVSLAGGADVNADGYGDVIVGACGGLGNGSVRVFSGRDGTILYTRHGQSANDQFGRSVGLLPDSDGDGFADFIVGIPADDDLGAGSGSVRVYSGRTGAVMHHIFGGGFLDSFGYAVAAAGSANGDGSTDFVIGMPFADPTETAAGNAQVYAASSTPFEAYCDAALNSTGSIAHIYALGSTSTSVSRNNFVLQVTGGPPDQFGLFFYGPAQTEIPFGNGNVCVASGGLGLFRLNPPQQLPMSGEMSRHVDLTDPPQPDGQITAGSTWYFQFWYRDPAAGGSAFNLSDGLSATFEP